MNNLLMIEKQAIESTLQVLRSKPLTWEDTKTVLYLQNRLITILSQLNDFTSEKHAA